MFVYYCVVTFRIVATVWVVNSVGIKFLRISNKVPTDYLRHLRSEKRNIPIYLCNDNDNDTY